MELTLIEFLKYFGWACFGQACSLVFEQIKFSNKIQREGGFVPAYWLKDNFWRIVGTILAMIAGITFSEQLTGNPINKFSAFVAGVATDNIMDAVIKRKK